MLPGAAAYSYLGHVGLAVAADQIGINRTALIAVGVVTLTICLPIFINKLRAATNQPPALTVVSARDLMRRLDTQENLAVLDVRNADEYTGPAIDDLEGWTRACLRQHRHRQAIRRIARDGDLARHSDERGRRATRRL